MERTTSEMGTAAQGRRCGPRGAGAAGSRPSRPGPRGAAVWALACALGLGGCASLLPRGDTAIDGGWDSYASARAAIESIEPYKATREDIHAMGLDPFKRTNVQLLSYSDLVQRFGAGNTLRADQLERGVRDCFEAGRRCGAYLIQQRQVDRKRVGNFWLDVLNFRRETDTTGWSFNALIVFVDDQVVFTLHGGQPKIAEHETSRNPLGPLQGAAESGAAQIFK